MIRLTNRSTGDSLTDVELVADRDGAQRLASVLSAAAAGDGRQEVQMEWRHEPTNHTTRLRVIVSEMAPTWDEDADG